MKDSQKRWKPDRTKRKGLSESYIRNASSICLRPGSSISLGRSRSKSNELLDGVKGISFVQGKNDDTTSRGIRNSKTAGSRVSNSLFRASYESRKSICKNDEYCANNVLRYQQKLEHDLLHLGIDSMRKSLNSQLDMNMIDTTRRFSTSISAFVLESEKVLYDLKVAELKICSNQGYGKHCKSLKQMTSQKDVFESNIGRGSEQFETSLREDETMSSDSKVSELSSCSFSCFGSALNDPEAYILGIRGDMVDDFENDSSKDYEHNANDDFVESKSKNCALLEEGGQPSSVVEVFSREATLNEYINEDTDYSNSSTLVPPKSLENLYHCLDLVMESLDTKDSAFEFFDSRELQLQLESLNLEPEETFSEASILDLSRDSRKVKRWIGDGESRSFSYMDFKKWHSLECPISPLVFNSLEKKYSKQASWPKSERHLLFDLINSQNLWKSLVPL